MRSCLNEEVHPAGRGKCSSATKKSSKVLIPLITVSLKQQAFSFASCDGWLRVCSVYCAWYLTLSLAVVVCSDSLLTALWSTANSAQAPYNCACTSSASRANRTSFAERVCRSQRSNVPRRAALVLLRELPPRKRHRR